MIAHDLAPRLWDSILDRIARQGPRTEYAFCRVTRRDDKKKLIWVREFGNVPIPLVAHTFGFTYYDTQSDGTVAKRDDLAGKHVAIVTPKKGALVVIVKPFGNLQNPICVGAILSRGYWEGAK